MTASPQRQYMSVEEYFQLCREQPDTRYEYLDGYAYMLAGGTARHSRIKLNISFELMGALGDGPCTVYDSDMKAHIAKERYFLPDISVSCDPRDNQENNDTLQFPRLIFEVLSPSTEAYDRGKKFRLYQGLATIQEYVLVDTQQPVVEVYHRAENHFWTYTLFGPGEQIELHSINVSIPITSIYKNIRFKDEK